MKKSIVKTGKMTAATFEYSALLSFSIIKRSGIAIKDGTIKVVTPVGHSVNKSFVQIKQGAKKVKQGTKKVFKRKKKKIIYLEKIQFLENKLHDMEQRMANLEKHGIAIPSKEPEKAPKKEVASDKRMLLQTIVAENIMLKSKNRQSAK